MHKLAIFSSLLLLTLTGCQTTYGPMGPGGGYSETRVDDDLYEVSFRGNTNIGMEKVRDLALLRAAELGVNEGFTFFTVLAEEDRTRVATDRMITRSTDRHDGHQSNKHDYGFPGRPGENIRISGRSINPHVRRQEEQHAAQSESYTSVQPGVMFLVRYFDEHPVADRYPNPILECGPMFDQLILAYELDED